MRRRGWLSANHPLEITPKCHVRKGDTVVVIAGKDRGNPARSSACSVSTAKSRSNGSTSSSGIRSRPSRTDREASWSGSAHSPLERDAVLFHVSEAGACGDQDANRWFRVRVCRKCTQPLEISERP